MARPTTETDLSRNGKLVIKPNGEEFLLRVSYTTTPNHHVRFAEVMADVGIPIPDPLPTSDEMQQVTFAAKMAMLKVLRDRKRKKKLSPKRTSAPGE